MQKYNFFLISCILGIFKPCIRPLLNGLKRVGAGDFKAPFTDNAAWDYLPDFML